MPFVDTSNAKTKPKDSNPPRGCLSMSSMVVLVASNALCGSASLIRSMMRSWIPGTGR